MDPTNPLGYISGYPSGMPTFSAGWTSNQAPNYSMPGWSGDPNAPGMTMAGNYGAAAPSMATPWWLQPPRTNMQPQPAPASAADNAQGQQFNVNPLMGMIPNSGILGLIGMLGGIPMSPQQMNSSGVASLLSGGQQGQAGGPNNRLVNAGMAMMAPRFLGAQPSTQRSLFGSIGGY